MRTGNGNDHCSNFILSYPPFGFKDYESCRGDSPCAAISIQFSIEKYRCIIHCYFNFPHIINLKIYIIIGYPEKLFSKVIPKCLK